MEQIEQQCDAVLSTMKLEIKGNSRIALIGIGNPYRGDDAAGLSVIRQIQGKIDDKILIIEAPDAPENHLVELLDWNPTHLLVIDAASMKKVPGTIQIINRNEIVQFTVSSHANSKLILFDFLESQIPDIKIYIIGIQVKEISNQEGISKIVQVSSEILAQKLIQLF